MWNGDMILCCVDQERSVVLGNCGERTIRDIWNDEAYVDLRRRWRTRRLEGLLWETCKGSWAVVARGPQTGRSVAAKAGVIVFSKTFAHLSRVVAVVVLARVLLKADFGALSFVLLTYVAVTGLAQIGLPESVHHRGKCHEGDQPHAEQYASPDLISGRHSDLGGEKSPGAPYQNRSHENVDRHGGQGGPDTVSLRNREKQPEQPR